MPVRTTLFTAGLPTRSVTLVERETSRPFLVVPVVDPSVYDDPSVVLTIQIETRDPITGRTRGTVSRHTGLSGGKSRRWASGLLAPPVGLLTRITVSTTKAIPLGVALDEADIPVSRPGPSAHRSIAFDEFDYAETALSADTLEVTNVIVDSGDLLVATASVFNVSGSTMTVSDGTNGTWTVATGSPVLPDPAAQAHIQYFQNSGAGTLTVTFDPTGIAADIDAVVSEVSGAVTSGALDQYVEATGAIPLNSGATATVTTATLAQANNIIFAIATHTAVDRTLTADAAFTFIAKDEDNSTSQAFLAEYLITAATTAVTATVVIGSATQGAQTWGIAAAVFKEAAAGGGAGGPVGYRNLLGVGQ